MVVKASSGWSQTMTGAPANQSPELLGLVVGAEARRHNIGLGPHEIFADNRLSPTGLSIGDRVRFLRSPVLLDRAIRERQE